VLAALSLLVGALTGGAFLPLTISTFAYAWAEKRHRKAWAGLAQPPVRVAGGPYRGGDLVAARLRLAPAAVRLAAVSAFYWAWCCAMAWIVVAFCASGMPPADLLVLTGLAVAFLVGRAGLKLLRRDANAALFAQRAALLALVHALLLATSAAAFFAADWAGLALLFTVLAAAQAALLATIARRHAPLFALRRDDGPTPASLPGWLARLLARRPQRRANFFTSASQTSPGA
jgi:hypothetical protein